MLQEDVSMRSCQPSVWSAINDEWILGKILGCSNQYIGIWTFVIIWFMLLNLDTLVDEVGVAFSRMLLHISVLRH